MKASYREHFSTDTAAASYEQGEYAPGSYASLLWVLEQETLSSWADEFRKSRSQMQYLDFASGTGRVPSFMERYVDSSTSIEISESMASVARQRLKRTKVLCADITAENAVVEGQYDLITAFRFFLNAEPALRTAAMRALVARLKDDDSWLVFNNHGNLWSIKLLAWPMHRLRRLGKGWLPKGNYLRHAEVMRLIEDAGLRLVRRTGLGVLGGTLCRLLPYQAALRLERWCMARPWISWTGQDILYAVCRDHRRKHTS
ncbi:MAG: class I SAM-dependent methyltransferase [Verrucomicrobia bacterium]|nr:class I SAM-dependent methyltransferase [Verrucomicrobiota bacterium]